MPSPPKIDVKISARADELTASIAKVRKQIAGLPALAQQASRKTGQIDLFGGGGRSTSYQLGYDRVEKQLARMGSVGRAGLGGIGSAARMIPGLGLVAGATSIGGMAEMMDRLAGGGLNLRNTAMTAGTSAAGLNSLRGAARLAGVSAETADGAIGGLNRTIQDAVSGANSGAARAFQMLGIDIGSVARGARSAEDVLGPLSDTIAAMMKRNPVQAERLVTLLGMPANSLPLLMRGSAALQANRREVERLYGSMDVYVASSERYTESTARMGMAGERLGISIVTNVEPHVSRLLERMARWTDSNSADIGRTFDNIGTALEGMHWSDVGAGLEATGRALKFATDNANLLTHGFEVMAGTTIIRAILGNTLLGRFLTAGLVAHEGLAAADPHDRIGSWIDRNIPGAAAADDWAARNLGIGRTYEQQRQAEEQQRAADQKAKPPGAPPSPAAPPPPAAPSASAPRSTDYQLKPVLDLIGRAEGTDRGRGYNETLGYGAYTGGDRDLTHMTLDQIDALQTQMLANPANKLHSSALGRYQFIQTTLREMRQKFGLNGNDLFDEAMQDRLVKLRIGQMGGLNPRVLAGEWASFPDPDKGGLSHYTNQRASVTLDQVNSMIRQASGGDGGGGSQHEIIVTLNNAPPGTTLQTNSAGSGAEVTGVRIRRAMEDAGTSSPPAMGGLY